MSVGEMVEEDGVMDRRGEKNVEGAWRIDFSEAGAVDSSMYPSSRRVMQ